MENYKFETEEQKRAFCLDLAVKYYSNRMCEENLEAIANALYSYLTGNKSGKTCLS